MKKHLKALLTAVLCGVAAAFVAWGFFKLFPSARSVGRLTESETASVLAEAEYHSPREERAVTAAASLLGRVGYFWGGKYDSVGECPDWGEPRTVTSEGNPTTGTVRPFGLDCSGFVTWAYIQAGVPALEIGRGTWNQWMLSSEIDRSELRPGDLGFANVYPGSSGNHIGICIGFFHGEPVFIHCSNVYDTVVVTGAGNTFKYFRRPGFAEGGE